MVTKKLNQNIKIVLLVMTANIAILVLNPIGMVLKVNKVKQSVISSETLKRVRHGSRSSSALKGIARAP